MGCGLSQVSSKSNTKIFSASFIVNKNFQTVLKSKKLRQKKKLITITEVESWQEISTSS
jgi:hypothetical protein